MLKRVLATTVLALAAGPASASAACPDQGVKLSTTTEARVEKALVCLGNEARVAFGRPKLAVDVRLRSAARAHSADMGARGFFSHINPDGKSAAARIQAAGYPAGPAGENIHVMYETNTAKWIHDSWMASPTHKWTILDSKFRHVGIGVDLRKHGATGYVTADFGTAPGAAVPPRDFRRTPTRPTLG